MVQFDLTPPSKDELRVLVAAPGTRAHSQEVQRDTVDLRALKAQTRHRVILISSDWPT
jgi:hypothetical protein